MLKKLRLMLKALHQLGWSELGPYLRYRFRLWSGILRLKTRPVSYADAAEDAGELALPLFPLPDRSAYRELLADEGEIFLKEADHILNREVRLFGGELYPLQLQLEAPLRHWTRHTGGQHHGEDIKLIWEPARFGWAVALARGYLFNKDEQYAAAFWQYAEEFLDANPPNIGPQWASGQEVALRMMSLSFAAGVMLDSEHTTPDRLDLLKGAIAAHAARITATLDYARAQNNNHLISEAAGLYTAAALLPEHSRAEKWRQLGWEWLNHALMTQISHDGAYVQHSTNYLRLILQLALFVRQIAADRGEQFPKHVCGKLRASTRWLSKILDSESGGAPNLGGNDGAYFLPLTTRPYADFRPVLASAWHAFLGESVPLTEMVLWLGGNPGERQNVWAEPKTERLVGKSTWGVMRTTHYENRPAHADQLHLDLWWRGINFAADPGVYQYNSDPPWDNPLDTTSYHNTLTVNDRPQMTKAGRFLWLDWAQGKLLDLEGPDDADDDVVNWIVAQHDGYRKLKLAHRRTVSVEGDMWMVRDQVLPVDESKRARKPVTVRLHWLLPDLEWDFNNGVLRLATKFGDVILQVRCQEGEPAYSLVRAGEVLFGKIAPDPVRGWISPTYAEKVPALSLAAEVQAAPPVTITTNWHFPD